MPFDLAAAASTRDRAGRSDCAPSFRCQRDDSNITNNSNNRNNSNNNNYTIYCQSTATVVV